MKSEQTGRWSKLSEAARQALLERAERVDATGDGDGRPAARREPRLPYLRPDVTLAVTHPGGGTQTVVVMTRTLWAGGVSLLHGGFLHAETACRIVLPRRLGDPEPVRGAVAACRHVMGAIHLIDLRFEAKIFPELYLDEGSWGEMAGDEAADPTRLRGRVLMVDDQPMDCELFAHLMKPTRVEVVTATDIAAATAALAGGGRFDLAVVDANLGMDETAEVAMAALRGAGYKGPFLLLTSETDPARLRAASAAGARKVLQKPYEPAQIYAALTEWLQGSGRNDEPIVSTMAEQDGAAPLLERYIEQVQKMVGEIRLAAEADDFKRVRGRCQSLKGTGTGYGFAILSAVAKEAVTALDASTSVAESGRELKRLETIAWRLAAKKP